MEMLAFAHESFINSHIFMATIILFLLIVTHTIRKSRSMELEKCNNTTKHFKRVQSSGNFVFFKNYFFFNSISNFSILFLQLVGYSLDDSFPFHKASQFNLAEIGAVSSDMPFMVINLIILV